MTSEKNYYLERIKKDPDYFKRALRKHRKTHPEKYYKSMARVFLRKLSKDDLLSLFREFEVDKNESI